MEMFVPVEKVGDVITEFRAYQDRVRPQHDASVKIFTGVRYVSKDDIWLSPNFGRDSAVVSFIAMGDSTTATAPKAEFSRYAKYLEVLALSKFEGRPHWGKMNWAGRSELAPQYSKLGQWEAVRNKLDPYMVFKNDYLAQRTLYPDTAAGQ
jgi:L-gulonolactone oxidase